MYEKFKKHVLEKRYFENGEKLIVAVSGGLDSMTLAEMMLRMREEAKYNLAFLHLDHGIREDSSKDRQLVEEFAARVGVPCFAKRVELGLENDRTEDRARKERYKFFLEAAREFGASKILTAHHSDDQVETVLQRFIRGASLRGLSGIPEKRMIGQNVSVIRPLLVFSRSEIFAYATERAIQFRDDYTNRERKYFRNIIRQDLIPYLEKLSPSVREKILTISMNCRDALQVLEPRASELLMAAKTDESLLNFDRGALAVADKFSLGYMLDKVYEKLEAGRGDLTRKNYEQFYDFLQSCKEGLILSLPGGVTAVFERGIIKFNPPPVYSHKDEETLSVPGEAVFNESRVTATVVDSKYFNLERFIEEKREHEEACDLDRAGGKLFIRTMRDGDIFSPLGTEGTKKLGDFFTDEKIPVSLRPKIPLVFSEKGLVWVVGHRISQWARIDNKTRRILLLTCKS